MMQSIVTEVSTLGDLLVRGAALHPDRPALILPNAQASYSELQDDAFRVARSLAGMGIAPGAHVALLLPNCVEFAAALFGVMLHGCVAVPLNARHRAVELGYIIDNAQVSVVLTSSDPADPVDFIAILTDALPSLDRVALVRGEGDGVIGAAAFHAFGTACAPDTIDHHRRSVRVRDPALIIYTSGTTANPKGCVLSHEAATRGAVERARYRLATGGHEVTWSAGPLFHIGSLAPFIGSIGVVGTYLTDTYFDAGRALALMHANRVTLAWPWFPAIVQGLIDHPDFSAARFDALRYLFIIAPPVLVDRVQELLPQTEVIQACGMTETGGIFALCGPDESRESRANTHGQPSPGIAVRIVDPETGIDLPRGTMGEILVRGYNVMNGYWAAPEKTAEALTPEGWLRTGDLYTQLENDSLVFGGRYKDMLKVGGENVAAIEVEAFLCTHPAVKTAEVVGRPDPRLDEVPVAFVELRAGITASEAEIIAHCKGRIASYKVPRAIHFVTATDWPMSATKIDKRALRERLTTLVD